MGDAAGIVPAVWSEFTSTAPHKSDHLFAIKTLFEYTGCDALNDWLLDGSKPYFMGVSPVNPTTPNDCVGSHVGVAAATQNASTDARDPPNAPLP